MTYSSTDPADVYAEAHWGIDPKRIYRRNIPGMHDGFVAVELGKLVELHVDADEPIIVEIDGEHRRSPVFFAFSPDETQRLHIVAPADVRRDVKRLFWRSDAPTRWLGDVARTLGGGRRARQNRWTWPRVRVQPVGVVTHVVYATDKQGDGYSHYIHEFGEVSGVRPVLAVSGRGELFLAGGNYAVPPEGITD